MWATISVYIALVLIAFVLYFLTRNTTKAGGKQSFWEWIRQGSRRNSGATSVLERGHLAADVANDVDAVRVLEDMYRELHEEIADLRQEMESSIQQIRAIQQRERDALRRELAAMKQAREHTAGLPVNAEKTADGAGPALNLFQNGAGLSNRGVQQDDNAAAFAFPPVPAQRTSASSEVPGAGAKLSEAVYFRILDDLQQGRRPTDIAENLGVSLHEVQRVIQFMSQP